MFTIPTSPFQKSGKKIESQVRKALYDYKMISKSGPLGIALSGGKDSLTLLFMLKAIANRGFADFDLHAFHVGGTFSCGASVEETFLKELCGRLKIPLHVDVSNQKLENLNCYSCSRVRRTKIFTKAKSIGIDRIAFGHHMDDSIETLMMNLLHKAEFSANLPKVHMESYGITILRPLIYVTEKQISSFATNYGFRRITCQCPVGQQSQRKKTKDLLNILEEYFPNAKTNLAKASRTYGSQKAAKR